MARIHLISAHKQDTCVNWANIQELQSMNSISLFRFLDGCMFYEWIEFPESLLNWVYISLNFIFLVAYRVKFKVDIMHFPW